eukprot:CAMPEP_0198336498 /NCGR_PEP_ID=MMETSP1450-20131203/21023_1 /TAXON_ID=753684 ORGANISM="Madagascaria erythrocladiodes, Strain CCMP3234" /NCGR_SAMPLE_ID=MMETSP1450 /ASSEMBLY_ACC=CAM_ASM_001115 /LENGTH=478 /DNA_ID=CAMNT_0044041241 /DNA_START=303 /DNA_END=1739 /DNA_ORIENTATION=-
MPQRILPSGPSFSAGLGQFVPLAPTSKQTRTQEDAPAVSRSGYLSRHVDASQMPLPPANRAQSFTAAAAAAAKEKKVEKQVSRAEIYASVERQVRTVSDVGAVRSHVPRKPSSTKLLDMALQQMETDASNSDSGSSSANSRRTKSSVGKEVKQKSRRSPTSVVQTGFGSSVFARDWPSASLQYSDYDNDASARSLNSNEAQDVLALPHNAIKKELRDLKEMLFAIGRRRYQRTTREEDDAFSAWFADFSCFLSTYLTMEEEVLFHLAQPGDLMPTEAQQLRELMAGFWEKRVIVRMALDVVNDSVENLFVLPMAKIYDHLTAALDDFVPVFLDYLARQEAVLPHYITKSCGRDMRALAEHRMADHIFSRSPNPRMDICILGAWMDKNDERTVRWRKNTFRGPRRVMSTLWEAKYIQTHKRVVERFVGAQHEKIRMTRVLRMPLTSNFRFRTSGDRSRSSRDSSDLSSDAPEYLELRLT